MIPGRVWLALVILMALAAILAEYERAEATAIIAGGGEIELSTVQNSDVLTAALLLLQTYSPSDYFEVVQYPVQAVYDVTSTNSGWTFCNDRTIYINLAVDPEPIRIAGTLAHEASHKRDYPFGCGPGLEAKAMRATLRAYRAIGSPPWRQEWAARMYWGYWHQEHPGRGSLGLLP